MSEGEALLRTVREHPDEDAPRLVYADWLEETGEPTNVARAEFIRVQCALSAWHVEQGVPESWDCAPRDWSERPRKLLNEHHRIWIEVVSPEVLHAGWASWIFRRGFMHGLRVHNAHGGRQLVHLMVLSKSPPELVLPWEFAGPGLFAVVEMLRMRRLSIPRATTGYTGDLDLEQLDACSHHCLDRLTLDGHALSAAELDTLARSRVLSRLTHLGFGGCGMGNDALIRLASSSRASQLSDLGLGTNHIGLPGVTALARSPFAGQLRHLDLTNNPLGPGGVDRLAEGAFPRLTALKLERTIAGDAGVVSLARSTGLPSLRWLHLGVNHLSDAAVGWLMRSGLWRRLGGLILNGNRLTDEAVIALAESPASSGLVALDLGHNKLTDRAAEALIASRHIGELTQLGLARRDKWPTTIRTRLKKRFGPALRLE